MNMTLDQFRFLVPDGLVEVNDRQEDGKLLVLYGGHIALLDVIKPPESGSLPALLLRLTAPPDQALDLFRHPALYATSQDARRVFDPQD